MSKMALKSEGAAARGPLYPNRFGHLGRGVAGLKPADFIY